MKNLLYLLFVASLFACAQEKQVVIGETDWQQQMNMDFKDVTKSPLTEKDRRKFKTLDFFPYDVTYLVQATLKRTPDATPFKMKTTTNRLANYVQYGILYFELKGKKLQLNIYRNLDLITKEAYKDYLFLPFLDVTNGNTTYGGGRYVEARIPEGTTITIDFNNAYNPYCAYNKKYSCPIVPRENYIDIPIKAGVKAFKH